MQQFNSSLLSLIEDISFFTFTLLYIYTVLLQEYRKSIYQVCPNKFSDKTHSKDQFSQIYSCYMGKTSHVFSRY